jgi:hypothetical protein
LKKWLDRPNHVDPVAVAAQTRQAGSDPRTMLAGDVDLIHLHIHGRVEAFPATGPSAILIIAYSAYA